LILENTEIQSTFAYRIPFVEGICQENLTEFGEYVRKSHAFSELLAIFTAFSAIFTIFSARKHYCGIAGNAVS
jgi:hypothetical protein